MSQTKSSILDWSQEKHFRDLASQALQYIDFDPDLAYRDLIAYRKGETSASNKVVGLEIRWYRSLREDPDYSVYSDPYYICDIWNCWAIYSRKALLELKKPRNYPPDGLLKLFGPLKKVADLGCGFGYTTAGLKELYPDAEIVGTNLKNTFQYKIAEKLGNQRDFNLVETNKEVGQADLVFASEYFEHFYEPISQLHDVVSNIKPTFMVIANGFNGDAIGHFDVYEHMGRKFMDSVMSKEFNKALKHYGYVKLKTKIWNQRPAIWMKTK